MKKQSYLKGAAVISLGGFISKLLGAVYRIPLVAFLGGEGMGLYQLVYPLYCILLTVSASGIPTGIARLISSGREQGAENRAFYLYGAIGLAGSMLMFAFSPLLQAVQGVEGVALCCRILSPSVFFVAIISVVRGYFQGKGNMYPTASTEVAEQLIKVCLGVALAGLFRGNVVNATAAAVFAVTVSEAACCLFAVAMYLPERRKKPLFKGRSVSYKSVFAYTVPLTLTAIALPFSQLLESIAVVNVLRKSVPNVTALYGIYSGCAVTMINLPVSVTYGLAAASVPAISPLSAAGDIKGAKQKIKKALMYTAAISVPAAVALFVFAPLGAKIIFPSLGRGESALLISLVRLMSVNAVTSSLVQTSSACITSMGRPLFGTLTQWSTSLLRVVITTALVAFTNLSVTGAALSANICYFVAVAINLCYIIGMKNKEGRKNVDNADRIRGKGRGFNAFG